MIKPTLRKLPNVEQSLCPSKASDIYTENFRPSLKRTDRITPFRFRPFKLHSQLPFDDLDSPASTDWLRASSQSWMATQKPAPSGRS